MKTRIALLALECFVDLGITIVYATIVGLLIVAVVVCDDGRAPLLTTILYASLLPGAVIVLIAIDVLLRIASERRTLRRRQSAKALAGKTSGERAFNLSRF